MVMEESSERGIDLSNNKQVLMTDGTTKSMRCFCSLYQESLPLHENLCQGSGVQSKTSEASSQFKLEKADWGKWRTKVTLWTKDGSRALPDKRLETGGRKALDQMPTQSDHSENTLL